MPNTMLLGPSHSKAVELVGPIRVLLLADTHIGFDHPLRPRSARPHRGPDFVVNLRRALDPAMRGEVDLVVHGGDLFHRSRPPPAIIDLGLAPLVEVADRGVPVVLVPGNHERSRIPRTLLGFSRHLHILDQPGHLHLAVRGVRLRIAGFPFVRDNIAGRFRQLVASAEANPLSPPIDEPSRGEIRLLVVHQTVEGATVGPANFTFRSGTDVIRASSIPAGYAAVLSGHIHRRQVLRRGLDGRGMAAPVVYPGSTERTSTAERNEPKGMFLIELAAGTPGERGPGQLRQLNFRPLPTGRMPERALGWRAS
jgi:DNA repair exonuclease SbcCD nuclease subunit